MSVLYSGSLNNSLNKQSVMRFRAVKSMQFLQKIFGITMVFFVVVLYFIWLLTGDIVKPITSSLTINDSAFVCNEKFDDNRKYFYSSYPYTTPTPSPLPTIYFVTPTYPRREQIAELTRLGQTLMHIPNLHWIVADDFDGCNTFLDFLLNRFGIPYTHIASPMPDIYRSYAPIPRGVANRRAAINWIRNNGKKSGVLYFGDDDNAFDLRLFSEIRSTQRVSMFPVGLIGLYAVSTPIVKQGKVIGFFDSWPANRLWPVDMAGFAVSLDYLALSPNATMPYKAGYEEDEFLKSIGLQLAHIEPKASNCSEILVWHTQTKKEKSAVVRMDSRILESDQTSLGPLLRELEALGVSRISSSSGIKAQVSKNGKSKPLSSVL